MKKQVLTLLAGLAMSAISITANAQWSGTNPLTTTSNVGIGTTTAAQKLDIAGNARIQGTNSIIFGNNVQPQQFIYGDENYGNTLVFCTGNAIRMGLNSTGLGIGTTAPNQKLDVVGNIRVQGTNSVIFGNNITPQQFIYGSEGTGSANTLVFCTGNQQQMFLNSNGLGIGTPITSSAYKLAVNGSIACKGLKIANPQENSGIWVWPDYVFAKDYKLKSLNEVEAYIEKENRLPDVPSAKEVSENGIEAAEMFKIQMQKIEELTLYMIEMKKENEALKAKVETLIKQ